MDMRIVATIIRFVLFHPIKAFRLILLAGGLNAIRFLRHDEV